MAVGAAVAILGFVVFLGVGAPRTPWTVDDAGKSAVLDRMMRSGGPWLDYPGIARDPELRFFPMPLTGGERYATVLPDGRILSQYTSPFLWLVLPLVKVAGDAGRGILPALAGGACVVLAAAIARRRGASSGGCWIAAGIAALATPLLFYSSVFWEHTLAAALAAGAILALTDAARARPMTAGLLAGGAALLREEMLLFCAAVAIAMAIARRAPRSIARFAVGCAFGAAALLAWNLAVAGTPWGVHVEANRPAFGIHAWRAIAALLLDPGFVGLPLLLAGAVFVVLAAAPALAPRSHRAARALELGALAVLAIVSALAFTRFPGSEDRALALIHSNSMLVAAPWALAVILPQRRDDLPLVTGALFVTLFVLFVPERSITGIHPGPRMLLPIFPGLAAALAAQLLPSGTGGRRFDFARTALLGVLLTVGVLWSARSLVLLRDKRTAMARISAAVAADPRRIVVTDLFWLPIELWSLHERKEFHLVSSSADLGVLSMRCAAQGEPEILYVTSPGSIRNRAPLATVANPGFPHFSIDLHILRP